MLILPTRVLYALALLVVVSTVRAQDQSESAPAGENAAVDTGFESIDEIIVRGRSLGDLRFEIRRSEEAVFARFNELNSTDDFDIHCRFERRGHMRARSCPPNFVRRLQNKASIAQVRAMQGQGNSNIGQLYALDARRLQGQLDAEMRQLAGKDEQLGEALEQLAQVQFALTLARGKTTLSREVTAASGTLPYGAARMFEVIMGVHPFRHPLTQPTFTIADVSGEIRKLEVECAEGARRIDYASGVDWTVPSGWSGCTLQVSAKSETTFRLYEF